ncbi:MAG: hypothetical protein HZY79_03305 [Rhodoblastus sp.]|nr:MAG: hypothetical protein HZY79_03305 [Rhodoblastus sp.]
MKTFLKAIVLVPLVALAVGWAMANRQPVELSGDVFNLHVTPMSRSRCRSTPWCSRRWRWASCWAARSPGTASAGTAGRPPSSGSKRISCAAAERAKAEAQSAAQSAAPASASTALATR